MDDLEELLKKQLAHERRVSVTGSQAKHMFYLQIAQEFTDDQCRAINPLLTAILDRLER